MTPLGPLPGRQISRFRANRGFFRQSLVLLFFSIACISSALFAAEPQLREIIVSYPDENNILQLYRVTEDGLSRRQITHSPHACMMPAVSPDGSKIVYVQQGRDGMTLWVSSVDGKHPRALTETGRHLIPSWLPDSKHIVWMVFTPGKDPAENSRLHIMNTETRESRRLFSDPQQINYSNSMPVVSPTGTKVAFVSNQSGSYRIWLSNLDGSDARPISPTGADYDETLQLPIEQKVPAWSPDGKWIAHWEGVEMVHMSKFTGKPDRARDKLISGTWNVWVVSRDGKYKRKAGRGDDPTWSPDGFVTRAFPDPQKGGLKIMVETRLCRKSPPSARERVIFSPGNDGEAGDIEHIVDGAGSSQVGKGPLEARATFPIEPRSGWEELPIVPPNTPSYGRFVWIPHQAKRKTSEGRGN